MIYLIKSGDYLKIGYSQYPEKRIYELQIGNPEKLKILSYKEGGRWDEKSLHQLCKDYKYRGEWFINCKEVIDIFNNYFIDYEGYNNIFPYSITELSELIGMKKSTISKIQRSLIEKGYLKKQVIIDENGKEKEISRTNI